MQDPEVIFSEPQWYNIVRKKFGNEPVLPDPIILPYKYNQRCKKIKNYGLYSVELGYYKLVMDPDFYNEMVQELKLGPQRIFQNEVYFKGQIFKVWDLYFVNGITDYILFEKSKFKYLKKGESEHKYLTQSKDKIEKIWLTRGTDKFNYSEFYLDEVCLSKKFDIFCLSPFSDEIYLSPRAIEFFSDYNVLTTEIWDWDRPTNIIFKED